MTFTLVLILLGALFILIIGISVIQQQKERAEAERRMELKRHRAIINETEAVLSNTGLASFPSSVILVLYKRINEALELSLTHLENQPQQADYQRRLADIQNQITTLSSSPSQALAIENFRLPDNDKQILELVQMLKKLKAIIRAENNKGKLDPQVFGEAENRIDSYQLRINVESMLSRSRAANSLKQFGSSKQMVSKALATLQAIKAKTPNDPFISRKVDEAKELLEEINSQQKQLNPDIAKAPKEDEDDIDMLFQPKKKW
ncbi:hypothetical protein Q4601_19460 [Shewanella sp. 1_MG-2023]|jgi:hypothetical protein|uniref:hypothetical protein n=1 Tax=unclassified Shewanella TaxID=196818 RepID=UPI000C828715|nr:MULTISPECIES: hypothetical protein [unclassified Shewanella]MCC4831482.1 hypothetical protein [Shewanella sp. 10N.7]MDO6612135.1 hypothetical protein [Shewanella sp. 7_MG-2023]MDO6771989.1 hypothetical protein [Shewanella sp. 2_MG-2023]MDO6796473.1 hypothetical protein [Shewanella sp. 1_MG-2023]PMG76389.1 hypothetical protein BCU84_13755 [Shewanella sp. 10N.286.51.B7]